MAWDAERVVQALREHVLEPDARIERRTDQPGHVAVQSAKMHVVATTADWLIAREPWVASAVRVVRDEHTVANMSVTYGLVLAQDGRVLYLNDPATMRGIGSWVGPHLDPLAYAELLAELYSCPPEAGPVVHPTSATPQDRAGELIRDVAQFHAEYDFVDPALVGPPQLRRTDAGTVLDFFSCHYFITRYRAIDVLRWNVTCGPGQPTVWQRDYVVKRQESP